MLHTGTVEEGTLALIKKLSNDENLRQYNLVGGTALALLIGHRKSIDIDLFSTDRSDVLAISEHLKREYKADSVRVIGNAVFCFINDVKIDIIPHPYIWLAPHQNIESIRMSSLDDIAAMKINAIIQSGQRLKDFVDIHFILEHRSLDQIINGYLSKYPNGHAEIAKMALLYHKDINLNFPVKILNRDLKWHEIAGRLKQAIEQPDKVFSFQKQVQQQKEIKSGKSNDQNRQHP